VIHGLDEDTKDGCGTRYNATTSRGRMVNNSNTRLLRDVRPLMVAGNRSGHWAATRKADVSVRGAGGAAAI
jgi:hypothetical protein